MKLKINEVIEDVRAELLCYEEGEAVVDSWEKEFREWIEKNKGKHKDIVADKNGVFLKIILKRSAAVLQVEMEEGGAEEIARRSRGTPRLANRMLKRVRDFAQVRYDGVITEEVARFALDLLDIDKVGLDQTDRKMLLTMIEKFGGGPVGLDTLAASINEESETIEDVYEPYLLQLGYIQRTPRGRVVTRLGYAHFGMTPPEG